MVISKFPRITTGKKKSVKFPSMEAQQVEWYLELFIYFFLLSLSVLPHSLLVTVVLKGHGRTWLFLSSLTKVRSDLVSIRVCEHQTRIYLDPFVFVIPLKKMSSMFHMREKNLSFITGVNRNTRESSRSLVYYPEESDLDLALKQGTLGS